MQTDFQQLVSQSKSKTSIDDFDRQTIQSKIMINLGTNPFMDTIQSPSCTSIQDYLANQEESTQQNRQQEMKGQDRQNGFRQADYSQYLKPPMNSYKNTYANKPAAPFQKKNLKNLLNKLDKQGSNNENDFTLQDSITDENPNIEYKVLELNNMQTSNYNIFDSIKKKNDKSYSETKQSPSPAILTASNQMPKLSMQETAFNTQNTSGYITSPYIQAGNDKNISPDFKELNNQLQQLQQKLLKDNYDNTNIPKTIYASPVQDNFQTNQFNQQNMNQMFNSYSQGVTNQTNNAQFNTMQQNQMIYSQNNPLNQNYQNLTNNMNNIQVIKNDGFQQQSQQHSAICSPTASQNSLGFKRNQFYEEIYSNLSQNDKSGLNNTQRLNLSEIQKSGQQMNLKQSGQQINQTNQDSVFISFQQIQVPDTQYTLQSPQRNFYQNGINLEGAMKAFSPNRSGNFVSFNNSFGLNQSAAGVGQRQFITTLQNSAQSHPDFSLKQLYQNDMSFNNNKLQQNLNYPQQQYNQMFFHHNNNNINSNNKCQSNGNLSSAINTEINSQNQLNPTRSKSPQNSREQNNNQNTIVFSPQIISNRILQENTDQQLYKTQQLPLQQYNQDILPITNQQIIRSNSSQINRNIEPSSNNNREAEKANKDLRKSSIQSSKYNGSSHSILSSTNKQQSSDQSYVSIAKYTKQNGVQREKENPITRLRNKSSSQLPQNSPQISSTFNIHQATQKRQIQSNSIIQNPQQQKNLANFKNMVSSLYNEEEKIKKGSKTNNTTPKNSSSPQFNLQIVQLNQAQGLNENNSVVNSLTTAVSATQTTSEQAAVQIDKINYSYKINNIKNTQQPQTEQKNYTPNQSPFTSPQQTKSFVGSQSLSQPRILNIGGKGDIQKDRLSPYNKDQNKDKSVRSQSCQKDAQSNNIIIQSLPLKQTSQHQQNYSKYLSTPNKQKPASLQLSEKDISQQFIQIQNSNNNIKKKQSNNQERGLSSNLTEMKFQLIQSDSPIRTAEPYSPFQQNTNRNSNSSFLYDLTSMKNATSSLNVAPSLNGLSSTQFQLNQQISFNQQQQQDTKNQNIQQQQDRQKTPLNQIDRNIDFCCKGNNNVNNYNQQYILPNTNQRSQNQQTISTLARNYIDQSLNTKKITSSQMEKKGKITQELDGYKKEITKNSIQAMKIPSKTSSIYSNTSKQSSIK